MFQFLSLGDQPPSNSFVRPDQLPLEQRFPLDVYLCESCYLVQLIDVVPGESIFDEYVYLSSSSKALSSHYAQLAKLLSSEFGLKAGDVVVDIGCNDGVLLVGYETPGLIRIGVEPSSVGKLAADRGLEVVRAFFGREPAREIVARHGRARVVTATNVFAHVDAIADFASALPALLADDGVFVIEAPYLVDLIEQTLFDTIYHEHLCYLALTPVSSFLRGLGLEVFDVDRVPFGASGPAIRVFVQKTGGPRNPGPRVARMLSDEASWGVGRRDRYTGYAEQVATVKRDLLALLERLRREGAQIGGYGAPAKGNTLLNYLGVTPETITCIAETNVLKQGRLTPGTHIPIVSEEAFLALKPDYALLLTWNYLDFFLEKSDYIRQGGRFIVPLPVPRVAP